jgi:hypothetical protein
MSEPIYEYVKGQGWVPTLKPEGRLFRWNAKNWRITAEDFVPAGKRSWFGRIPDLLGYSDHELIMYARRQWFGNPGYACPEDRTKTLGKLLFLFTEVP